jgi:GH15 family glucan-1,4-alpha-glucosidase
MWLKEGGHCRDPSGVLELKLRKAHDAIYRRIMNRGWSPTLNAFVHYEGTDVVDAAVLLMPLVK